MQEAFAVHKSTAKVRLRVCVLRVPLVSNFIGTKITVAELLCIRALSSAQLLSGVEQNTLRRVRPVLQRGSFVGDTLVAARIMRSLLSFSPMSD